MRHKITRRWATLLTVSLLLFGVAGCSWIGDGDVDAAGMTQAEVEALSPEEQFNLFGERYVVMQEMLADAQRAVSSDSWTWGSKGTSPNGGLGQRGSMRGATNENSYMINTSRTIKLPGASGEKADLDPMIEYFESQGWSVTVGEYPDTGNFYVRGGTRDGFGLQYTIRPHGQYSLELISKVFWGDTRALSTAIVERIPAEEFEILESLPGEYIAFPKWSDPIVTTIE